MKCLLLIIVLCQFSYTYCQREWVDPYDMNPQPTDKKYGSSNPNNKEIANRNNCGQTQDNSIHLYYLKRLTSLLLHSATLDKSDSLHYHGHILFTSDKENYDFLKQFANEQNPSEDILRKLDAVFSESLGKSVDNAYIEVFLDFHNKLYYTIFSVQTLGLLGACILLYIVYQLFMMNVSLKYVFGYLFTIMLVADFYLRYLELEKEAIEHNAHLTYSALCDTEKMNWYEYMQFLASSRDCEKKVVTPLSVFLFQFKSLIIVPLHALGTGMGGFGKEMFINLPWGLNLVMWPVMMLCCCIMAIFFMSFMTDQPIEFNFFYMVKMKFGKSDGFHMNSLLSGKTLEKLINTVCNQLPQAAPVENVGNPILNDMAPIQHARRRNQNIRDPRELIQDVIHPIAGEPVGNGREPIQNFEPIQHIITEPVQGSKPIGKEGDQKFDNSGAYKNNVNVEQPVKLNDSEEEDKSSQDNDQSEIIASETTTSIDDNTEASEKTNEDTVNNSRFLEEIGKILDK